eukprot:UN16054
MLHYDSNTLCAITWISISVKIVQPSLQCLGS